MAIQRIAWCVTIADDKTLKASVFEVGWEDNDSIAGFRKKIKQEESPRLDHVSPGELVIWKCIGRKLRSDESREKVQEFLKDIDLSDTEQAIEVPSGRKVKDLGLEDNEVLLVRLPRDRGPLPEDIPVGPASRKRQRADSEMTPVPDTDDSKRQRADGEMTSVQDIDDGDGYTDAATMVNRWRSKRSGTHLPSVHELRSLIHEPLADSEKIPLAKRAYLSLISALPPDTCRIDDIDMVFKVGEAIPGLDIFYTAAWRCPPPSDGTEASYISFWDDNIRKAIELLVPRGKTIRNSNKHTETRKLRPDFGYILYKMCPFRGEEKAPDNPEDPRAELADKLNWVYDPAPYMLGYYVSGSDMTLAAIVRPRIRGGKAHVEDIVNVDLNSRKDRIANIKYLINLSTIIPELAKMVRGVDDFERFARENSIVEITSRLVIKQYTCRDAGERVTRLAGMYAVLRDRKVPNTDGLVWASDNTVHLGPRGLAVHPMLEEQLLECLICTLDVLKAIHKIPIYHRDIRWNNVIQRLDDRSKWILIDWEDASASPTKAEPTFSRSTHSPAVFADGHGSEVDIWGIGYLILTCQAQDISINLKAIGNRIKEESHQLSAEDVEDLITSYRTSTHSQRP